jgi:hypothetical protein
VNAVQLSYIVPLMAAGTAAGSMQLPIRPVQQMTLVACTASSFCCNVGQYKQLNKPGRTDNSTWLNPPTGLCAALCWLMLQPYLSAPPGTWSAGWTGPPAPPASTSNHN